MVTERNRVQKRKELDIDCSQDAGTPATFVCARCLHPFCENCVGLESRNKTYCISCSASLEAIEEDANRGNKEKTSPSKPYLMPLSILFYLFIAASLYLTVTKALIPSAVDVPAPEPLTAVQEQLLYECKEKLNKLSIIAANYQAMKQQDPEDIDALLSDEEDKQLLFEPVDEDEYVLDTREGKGIVIACPDPDAHQLYDLYAPLGNSVVVEEY